VQESDRDITCSTAGLRVCRYKEQDRQCKGKGYTEACSCNYCCSRKALHILSVSPWP